MKDKMLKVEAKEVNLDQDGAFKDYGWICVPRVDGQKYIPIFLTIHVYSLSLHSMTNIWVIGE